MTGDVNKMANDIKNKAERQQQLAVSVTGSGEWVCPHISVFYQMWILHSAHTILYYICHLLKSQQHSSQV